MKRFRCFLLLSFAVMSAESAPAQTPYKLPPGDVVAILDAPPPPLAIDSPTRDALLLVDVQPYPSIEMLAEPVLRLAGVRINPRIGGSQRTIQFTGMTIQPLDNSPARRDRNCRTGRVFNVRSWSNDGKRIAFARDLDDAGRALGRRRGHRPGEADPRRQLNDVLVDEITWLSDNRHILAVLVPEGRGAGHRRRRGLPSVPTCRRAPAE